MYFIGIDPGVNGGIAVLRDGENTVWGLSLKKWTEKDAYNFLEPCRGSASFACIERITPMPGIMRGVVAACKIGESYGLLRGFLVALEVSYERVTAGKWQRAMGCLSHGDKNVTKQRAQELFPAEKITHWLADALLLAEYARRLGAVRGGQS